MGLVQKEVKKVFKGTQLVRPPVTPVVSYNFRELTLSDLQQEGWLSQGYIAINSTNGAYSTNDGRGSLWCPIDLTGANRLVITCVYDGFNSSRVWNSRMSITRGGITNDESSPSIASASGLIFFWNNGGSYQWIKLYFWTSQQQVNWTNIPSGVHTYILDIDFVTGYTQFSCDWISTAYATMTQAQITQALESNYINLTVNYNGWRQHKLYSMSYEIS